MKLCMCGNAADDSGTLCSRCAALQTLELKYGATGEEIKAAYHLLVKVWHPDRFAHDPKLKEAADEKLKAINSAYLLLSCSSGKTTRKRWSRREDAGGAQRQPASDAAASQPAKPAPTSRGAKLRGMFVTFAALGMAQRLLILAGGLGTAALFAKFVESQLSSDPETARVYMVYKQAIAREAATSRTRVVDQMQQSLRSLIPFRSPVAAAPAPTAAAHASQTPPEPAPMPTAHAAKKAQRPTIRLLPYVTVGLTEDEVIAAAGAPVSSSQDKLAYKGAEIDFTDGKVSGWKIDPFASPIRVKLWPDAPVDTSLQVFSVGSTKNDVLVVQGTPTSFSEDKFGYGASEVYFQNDRVVSWKNDPSSVPLRAISR